MSHIDLGFSYDVGFGFGSSGVAHNVWADPSAWTGTDSTSGFMFTRSPADNGVPVTPISAMYSAAVWQGLNIISGDCGMMPIEVIRRQGESQSPQRNHPGARVLRRPHKLLRGGDFRELMQMRAILYGNAVAVIGRDDGGRATDLTPLPPETTYVKYDKNGELWYHTRVDGEDEDRYMPDEVLHITSLSTNGLWGLPLVQVAKNVIGDDLGLQMFANRSFANGATPGGYIKVQGRMTPEEQHDLREDWQSIHGGLANSNRIGVLTGSKEWVPLSNTHEQAQMIEARKFAVEQVSRVLLIPSFKLNALDRATFNNIEEMQRQYLVSLQRWLTKWTDECEAKLLTERQIESGDWFFHWVTNKLIQLDAKTRAEVDGMDIASRVRSPNEARLDRGINPYEGGDKFENPNTTSGVANDSPPASESGNAIATRLLADKLRSEARIESEQLRRAANSGKDFVDFVAAFYARDIPERLSLLLNEDTIASYCTQRKMRALEMAMEPNLLGKIESDSELADTRANQLLNLELGGAVQNAA